MVWRGMWNPPFKSGSLLQFRSPSNVRLPRSLLSAAQNHGVWKVWTPHSLDNSSLLWPSPLYFPNPPFLARLFQHYCLNDILNKNKSKLMWQSYFFIFRRLKNNVICFYKNTFISNTRLRLNPKYNNFKYQKESKEK